MLKPVILKLDLQWRSPSSSQRIHLQKSKAISLNRPINHIQKARLRVNARQCSAFRARDGFPAAAADRSQLCRTHAASRSAPDAPPVSHPKVSAKSAVSRRKSRQEFPRINRNSHLVVRDRRCGWRQRQQRDLRSAGRPQKRRGARRDREEVLGGGVLELKPQDGVVPGDGALDVVDADADVVEGAGGNGAGRCWHRGGEPGGAARRPSWWLEQTWSRQGSRRGSDQAAQKHPAAVIHRALPLSATPRLALTLWARATTRVCDHVFHISPGLDAAADRKGMLRKW